MEKGNKREENIMTQTYDDAIMNTLVYMLTLTINKKKNCPNCII